MYPLTLTLTRTDDGSLADYGLESAWTPARARRQKRRGRTVRRGTRDEENARAATGGASVGGGASRMWNTWNQGRRIEKETCNRDELTQTI